MTAGADRRTAERAPKETRHRAREAALQMLYQWEVGRVSMFEVRQTFWTQHHDGPEPLAEDQRTFATALADGVAGHVEEIDPLIAEAAEHWRLERMNVMDRLILRLAVYEFLHQPETPPKVIINEALELARSFSGDEAVRFINGLLDGIRRKLGRE
jgi:transcription antitermination protein NusB